jgi:hypothetical protein
LPQKEIQERRELKVGWVFRAFKAFRDLRVRKATKETRATLDRREE